MDMHVYKQQITEAADFIRSRVSSIPEVALVLGSGSGGFVSQIDNAVRIPYSEVPNMRVSTVKGHDGSFIFGTIKGKPVMVMSGRLHMYEGYEPKEITFPIRIMQLLGVKVLVLTNAAGGVNTLYTEGCFMMLRDHINFTGRNPLIGPNDETLGTRFPDMSCVYDPELRAKARAIAEKQNIPLYEGVYMQFYGPSFETPAEIVMARTMGADAVGMSTVPEAIVARHAGMRVFALSTITNKAAGVSKNPLSHAEVIEVGQRVEAQFTNFLSDFIAGI
ncbi:MAG: purine-nucleoside phosphorylase [Clostridiales bacterium]|nr:purine-nucleoside phosphorylase [Clostridiales bacterium]